jgi:low temperature requirement protein LtrA
LEDWNSKDVWHGRWNNESSKRPTRKSTLHWIDIMAEEKLNVGRKLTGQAVLWQDWDEEAEEAEVGYWELFTDLLMVAACSAIADGLKEKESWDAFIEFTLLYMIVVNSWLLYTHHYSSRFEESSLTHTFVLLFFLLGMASSVVNAGYETASMFSLSVIWQRVAVLCMIVPIVFRLPRASYFCKSMSTVVVVSICLYGVAAVKPQWAPVFWALAAAFEHFLELWLPQFISREQLVPVNIDHTKDRLGVLVLVTMGETVISSTMTYRELAKEDEIKPENASSFYWVLTLSFVLVFMFTLMFFNGQPAPKDHALRRSRVRGASLLVLNKTLGLPLLMIGVSIKLAVDAVAKGEEMSEFGASILALGVGSSMTILLAMRACHYAGILPRAIDPPHVVRIMYFWWAIMGVSVILPFLFIGIRDPVAALATQSGLLVSIVLIEAWITHVLQGHVDQEYKEEHSALLAKEGRNAPAYDAVAT